MINLDCLRDVIDGKDLNRLSPAFSWASTEQGDAYWRAIYENRIPLTEEVAMRLLELGIACKKEGRIF